MQGPQPCTGSEDAMAKYTARAWGNVICHGTGGSGNDDIKKTKCAGRSFLTALRVRGMQERPGHTVMRS